MLETTISSVSVKACPGAALALFDESQNLDVSEILQRVFFCRGNFPFG